MTPVEGVRVPDIGDFESVDVVEVLVSPGDEIQEEDSLISLESDKATMDVPAPKAGKVQEVKVAKGDKVSEGDLILTLEVADGKEGKAAAEEEPQRERREPERAEPEGDEGTEAVAAEEREEEPKGEPPRKGAEPPEVDAAAFRRAHASPAVRRFARELGVDLSRVEGSGRQGRIVKEDVQAYVKGALARPGAAPGIPEVPRVDFSKFGAVERRPLTRIQRISGPNLRRSWLNVPHVTQHDEADITDLDAFRRAHREEARERGFKLTFLAFLLKACVPALREFPTVNSSLDPDGEHLIVKKYVHIGVAVDTEEGLVVPVIRDVDRKGIFELARELAEVSDEARRGKLTLERIQGASFTISSLGGIGGTAFTPIVNAPEAAILGVSRAAVRPVYRDGELVPRRILPLSLSYDHRIIDGATAARFTRYLADVLSDLRRILL